MVRRPLLLVVICLLVACAPKLVVGERTDSSVAGSGAAGTAGAAGADGDAGAAGAQCPDDGSAIPDRTTPMAVPWTTGFENGFCDYPAAGGFCYGGGTHKTVSSPAKAGQFAAEFTVTTADTTSNQARCVREGRLPDEAFYGAWYYVPALATLKSNMSLWNLWHFRGGDTSVEGLWDISLVNGPTGDLHLLVYDFLNKGGTVREPANPPPIPIGSWFHIQFYLKRASDATGEIRLYQDGNLLLDVKNVVTDDSSWAQWYVGNIAKELTPPDSTVYVDDVSIDSKL